MTPEEYLAAERQAETKSEYFVGEVYAMSGACEQHNLIVTNLVAALATCFQPAPNAGTRGRKPSCIDGSAACRTCL